MNDPELQRVADFLAPRLRVLAEGQEPGQLHLSLTRLGPARAVFRLYAGEALLTEREQSADADGFDALELWLAMKNAWVRSRELRPPEPRTSEAVVSPLPDREAEARPVTVALSTVLQGDGLSAYGAALGLGRGAGAWASAGELSYARAPVDDALTVHHLFVQSHLGYALADGLALEGSARLTAQFAVAGAQSSATFDLGLGLSGHIWLGQEPELWLRATVLAHPVNQRYLYDGGERTSNQLTFSVAAGVGL